ncbi:hypothetical protein [Sphingobium yanoikuyae]|nr:hypothetical protein [Sphingobium yanoikuyae]
MNRLFRRKAVNANPVCIAGDGAIAIHGVNEGRVIPLVILDTSVRTEINEYIRIHQFSGHGDVTITWGQALSRPDTVSLMLNFIRPVELSFAIIFELQKAHSILVEGALCSGGLYLQAGVEGDRVRNTIEQPRVVIEIPDTGFRPRWEKICQRYLAKKMRAAGLDRKAAKHVAAEQYSELQKMALARPFPS